ncbi:zinc finger protein 431 isoform X1 [Hydra vulgaris]|uniref:zinc finger protein 431 isoform X1 n=1 Tax=Hydra vulgaris TaxID=6087 RepID=UPI0002B434D4|nr:zinc finger protein 431-like [Hydra vulgaris]
MAETSTEDVFLAEKVVDSGFGQQDGKRYYKVKWVRYTWEAEDALTHLKDMLDRFWEEHNENQNKLKSTTETTIHGNSSPEKNDQTILQTQKNESTEVDEHSTINESGLAVSVLLKSEANEAVIFSESETSGIQHEASSAEDSFSEKSTTIDKHSCGICLRSYSSQQSLRHHKRTHHQNEKSFQCNTCLKYFVERSTLKRHMIIHMDEKPYKCDHCDRAFSDKSTLRRHIITHTGIKRFVCTNCNKMFTRNEHLRQHMYIHTAEKLYKCDVCSKDFRQRSTLKNHMLLHRSDKTLKWKCDTCNTLFEFQHEYEVHIAICDTIGGGQGNKCQFCEKRFFDNDVLLQHILSHTEKSYKCEFCNKSFLDKAELTNHEFLHSEKKPYKCVICDEDFMRKGSLLSHIASQHPEQAVYELVDPSVDYRITDGVISLDSQPIAEPVHFVLPNNTRMNNVTLPQIKTEDKIKNNSLENISSDIINTRNNASTINIRNNCMVDHTPPHPTCSNNETEMQQEDDQLNLHPEDNQMLQVDIVQMDSGNQFVQSIHIIQPNQHLNNQTNECQSFKSLKNCIVKQDLSNLVVDDNLILGGNDFSGELSVDKA